MYQGTLFIVSAPSGAGKTSLVNELVACTKKIAISISHTTRPQRQGEENGLHYHFIDREQFQKMANTGQFLEHAQVFGNYYGTSQAWVEGELEKGRDIILEIDWQGAQQVRRLIPSSVSVFVLPPSKESLEQRLQSRGKDSEEVINQRLEKAVEEMQHYVEADFVIINDEFELALQQLKAVVISERLKIRRQMVDQSDRVKQLLS